jgi:hypothetical protein
METGRHCPECGPISDIHKIFDHRQRRRFSGIDDASALEVPTTGCVPTTFAGQIDIARYSPKLHEKMPKSIPEVFLLRHKPRRHLQQVDGTFVFQRV